VDRYTDINQTVIESRRAAELAEAAQGLDDDLIHDGSEDGLPSNVDQRTRDVVAYYQDDNGEWHPTELKRDDDIEYQSAIPLRTIGPARERTNYITWCPWIEDALIVYPEYVTDRAPVDPQETPMPIIPEVVPEEPMMMGVMTTQRARVRRPRKKPTKRDKHAKQDFSALLSAQSEPVRAKLEAALVARGFIPKPKPTPWICRLWNRLFG
jgi:hypothetical protein